MKNMQTVLESVLLEIHQSKEDNLKFKQDVSNQLHDIFSHQQTLGDSLVAISKDLPTEIHKLCMSMVTENHNSAEISRLGDPLENYKIESAFSRRTS